MNRRDILKKTLLSTGAVIGTTTLVATPSTAVASAEDFHSVKDFGAVGDGNTDDTNAIQNAINAHKRVYIPEGVYRVKPNVGIELRTGTILVGDGMDATIIKPDTIGGSIFKRGNFDPSGTNEYVMNVKITNLSVMIQDNDQIAFDFRHITRSHIGHCYAGTYARGALRLDGNWHDPANQALAIKGYGVVLGSLSSSSPAYAGGEVNTITHCQLHGLKKAIVCDDLMLSPASAAHSTQIFNNDVQICESGIAIESRYNAGSTIRDNTVQAIRRASGSSNTTYAYRLEGYGCLLSGGYAENIPTNCDYLIYLGANSYANKVEPFYASDSDLLVKDDSQSTKGCNLIQRFDPITQCFTDTVKDSSRPEHAKAWVTFDSVGEIKSAYNVDSVTKINGAAGDFIVNFKTPFSNEDFAVSGSGVVNTSAHAGIVTVRSQNTNSVRVVTYNVITNTYQDFQKTMVVCY